MQDLPSSLNCVHEREQYRAEFSAEKVVCLREYRQYWCHGVSRGVERQHAHVLDRQITQFQRRG
jgi:hypothetical protein